MSLLRGLKVTAAGTMLSRVLGMVRDMATAYRFGAGAVMDALVLALRVPDLFRRLFGEGVLGASLIPILGPLLPDRKRAWKFFTAALLATSLVPLTVVLIGEFLCGWTLWQSASLSRDEALAAALTARLLPYVVLVCLLAQLAAALHALNRFTAPALVSCVLNLVWIAACIVAPWWADTQAGQAKFLTLAVVASGVLQVAWLFLDLAKQGWRPAWPDSSSWRDARRALAAMLPAGLAISATQINTTIDGLTAWWLSRTEMLPVGAASAIYFGERMFMLPVGVVGVATAVVLFPTLCQMADQGRHAEMAEHTRRALQGVWLLAAPASVGLAMLASPVVAMLLQRGEFGADDSQRAADVASMYALGIWAFAMLPLLVRVELALHRSWRAAMAGAVVVVLNASTALTVGVWKGESALATTTTLLAVSQLLWLIGSVRQKVPIPLARMLPGLLRVALAAALMAIAIYPWSSAWQDPVAPPSNTSLILLIVCGATVHLGSERALRRLLPDPSN